MAGAKKIESETVKLYRFLEDTWRTLDTSIVGGDGEYVYFENLPPGFSPFTISLEIESKEID